MGSSIWGEVSSVGVGRCQLLCSPEGCWGRTGWQAGRQQGRWQRAQRRGWEARSPGCTVVWVRAGLQQPHGCWQARHPASTYTPEEAQQQVQVVNGQCIGDDVKPAAAREQQHGSSKGSSSGRDTGKVAAAGAAVKLRSAEQGPRPAPGCCSSCRPPCIPRQPCSRCVRAHACLLSSAHPCSKYTRSR